MLEKAPVKLRRRRSFKRLWHSPREFEIFSEMKEKQIVVSTRALARCNLGFF